MDAREHPRAPALVELTQTEDVEQLAARVYEDPANRKATGWMHEEDKQEAIDSLVGLWRRRLEGGWSVFRVEVDGREVGLAGHGPCGDLGAPPGLGIYLLERGRGLGTQVTQQLIERARDLGARRMETVVHGGNQASMRLLERLGFKVQGPCQADWAQETGEPWLGLSLEL